MFDSVAGAVAANSIVRTSIGISGLTALLTWFVWAIFIFVIGVKIFPDKGSKVPFKKILIAVGYAHAPGLIRFFAVTPDLVLPILRHVVRRAFIAEKFPYSEIQDNTIGSKLVPIDMLRLKLSFFGAGKW